MHARQTQHDRYLWDNRGLRWDHPTTNANAKLSPRISNITVLLALPSRSSANESCPCWYTSSFPQTAARPVWRDLPPLRKKNHTAAKTAVTSHNSMLTKSIQTAFFILVTPESPSGFSWMYSLPKMPKTATQRMLYEGAYQLMAFTRKPTILVTYKSTKSHPKAQ